MVVAYVAGVRRLARRGRRWPRSRNLSFGAGAMVLVLATQTGLARYEELSFAAHSGQHVLVGMVAPAFLAGAAPVTLALQAASRPLRQVLLAVLHSGPARLLGHPMVVWVVFGGTLVALYGGPLLEASLRHEAIHGILHAHFLLAGLAFAWIALGVDPHPARLAPAARVGFVFLAVPVHAVLGSTLVSGTGLVAGGWYARTAPPWLGDVLTDQRTGAGILWAAGELFGLVLTGVALARWMATDERSARRHDAVLDRRAGAPSRPSRP